MAIDMTGFGGALSASSDEPAANPFDLLTPEEFEALQQEAELAAESAETPADEAAESDEQQAEEAGAGTEMHTPEQMFAIASDARDAIDGCVADVEAKLAQAEENEESDPDALQKLLDELTDLKADADAALEDAKSAANDEDVGAAAEAAAEVERLREEAYALFAEAEVEKLVGTPPEPEEGEEQADVAEKSAAKEKPKPAMAIWAARA